MLFVIIGDVDRAGASRSLADCVRERTGYCRRQYRLAGLPGRRARLTGSDAVLFSPGCAAAVAAPSRCYRCTIRVTCAFVCTSGVSDCATLRALSAPVLKRYPVIRNLRAERDRYRAVVPNLAAADPGSDSVGSVDASLEHASATDHQSVTGRWSARPATWSSPASEA